MREVRGPYAHYWVFNEPYGWTCCRQFYICEKNKARAGIRVSRRILSADFLPEVIIRAGLVPGTCSRVWEEASTRPI